MNWIMRVNRTPLGIGSLYDHNAYILLPGMRWYCHTRERVVFITRLVRNLLLMLGFWVCHWMHNYVSASFGQNRRRP